MVSKPHERVFLDGLLRERPELTFVRGSESPDFIVRDKHGEVGVEVRQVFRDTGRKGSPKRTRESSRDKYLKLVAKDDYERGGRPIRVLSFMKGMPDTTSTESFADHLLSLPRGEVLADMRTTDPSGSAVIVRPLPAGFAG